LRDFVDDQQVWGEEGTVFDPECLVVLEECLGICLKRNFEFCQQRRFRLPWWDS
jgi:hypothetical protein